MLWELPPRIKVYEALGCIGDGRIDLEENTAKVFSSSRGKFYTVSYNPERKAIMSNDNGSYWKGHLGYPAIALLMAKGVLTFDEQWCSALKDVAWKDINVKHKNDFDATLKEVLQLVKERGYDATQLETAVDAIMQQLAQLQLSYFGKKTKPPEGY